jgi:hypothetical protein
MAGGDAHFSSAGANALELPYTREMMAGLLLRDPPWPRQALLIGLGAGSLAKFIYHQLPATRITVVEIDPQVESSPGCTSNCRTTRCGCAC